MPAHFYVRVNRPTAADEWTDTDGTTPVTLSVLQADATDPDGNQHLVASSVQIIVPSQAGSMGLAAVRRTRTAASPTRPCRRLRRQYDVFQYTSPNGNGGASLPANFFVRVNRPTAADEWTDTDGTTPVTLSVLANATDPDGNQHLVASSVTITTQPAHGTSGQRQFGRQHHLHRGQRLSSGTDVFQYTITDDNGGVQFARQLLRARQPTRPPAASFTLQTNGTASR